MTNRKYLPGARIGLVVGIVLVGAVFVAGQTSAVLGGDGPAMVTGAWLLVLGFPLSYLLPMILPSWLGLLLSVLANTTAIGAFGAALWAGRRGIPRKDSV